jgi:phage-related protein
MSGIFLFRAFVKKSRQAPASEILVGRKRWKEKLSETH